MYVVLFPLTNYKQINALPYKLGTKHYVKSLKKTKSTFKMFIYSFFVSRWCLMSLIQIRYLFYVQKKPNHIPNNKKTILPKSNPKSKHIKSQLLSNIFSISLLNYQNKTIPYNQYSIYTQFSPHWLIYVYIHSTSHKTNQSSLWGLKQNLFFFLVQLGLLKLSR